MTLEEVLIYFNVIKRSNKRKKPLTDEELLFKYEMMLEMKALTSSERKLAKTMNYMERAKKEVDAPLNNEQKKKKCLDPEEEHKKFIDLCRKKMHEVNANINFADFNGTQTYDWKKDLEDSVLDPLVWDGPIVLDETC
ncbi:hypothetical protein ACHQM5_005015 [Ranunculus cassubicifolius]